MRNVLVAVAMCLSSLPAVAEEAPPTKLDPRGSPIQKLTNVESARYFVWLTDEGWHLRVSSHSRATFVGTITLTNGTFHKLRPAGLDPKEDSWKVNTERTQVEFKVSAKKGFDGFDFSVKGEGARVEYQLQYQLKGTDLQPADVKRIIIGGKEGHPEAATFSFPNEPD